MRVTSLRLALRECRAFNKQLQNEVSMFLRLSSNISAARTLATLTMQTSMTRIGLLSRSQVQNGVTSRCRLSIGSINDDFELQSLLSVVFQHIDEGLAIARSQRGLLIPRLKLRMVWDTSCRMSDSFAASIASHLLSGLFTVGSLRAYIHTECTISLTIEVIGIENPRLAYLGLIHLNSNS